MNKADVGFVLLAHEKLHRTREVVEALLSQGAPVALHLDKKLPASDRENIINQLSHHRGLHIVEPHECHWGHWSIVEATLAGTRLLMKKEPHLDYIYHISGSCLPIRTVDELRTHLGNQKENYDHIESAVIGVEKWVQDGLEKERVDYFHFFNWKKNRWLFDISVKLQRLINFKRRTPEGLTPSLGSEWWCMSTKTLRKIFSDPKIEQYKEFFKTSWIPDESFMQTLARKHSLWIASKSLTYSNFDHQGKPFTFYDDHLPVLKSLNYFFVRKVWSGADELYSHFLNPDREQPPQDPKAELKLSSALEQVKENALNRRIGLVSQFSISQGKNALATREKYHIFLGFDHWKKDIYAHFQGSETIHQMGQLFHPSKAESQIGENLRPLAMEGQNLFRNYQPYQFLQQQIWYNYPKQISFLAKPHQIKKISSALAKDPNANLYAIKGAWILEVMERNINNIERLRQICQIHARREADFFKTFKEGNVQANINVISLGAFLADPVKASEMLPENFRITSPYQDVSKLKDFLEKIAANGVPIKSYDLEAFDGKSQSTPENVIKLKKRKSN